MEFLVGLFIVVVVLGALAGGRSFGGTIVNGIGCLFVIIIALVFFAIAYAPKS